VVSAEYEIGTGTAHFFDEIEPPSSVRHTTAGC